MTPIIFINCRDNIFVDQIIAGKKLYETRTKNTLSGLTNRRVLIAETGRGCPVVRCSATLYTPVEVKDKKSWDCYYRDLACIEEGSRYDWNTDTTSKFCYMIGDVKPVKPFIPPEGKRHGRVWMEFEKNTLLTYLYRDASNYKTVNEVVINGSMTDGMFEELKSCCDDGVEMFIPQQVGLDLDRGWDVTEDDHPWAEIMSYEYTTRNPTSDMSVRQLLDQFRKAKANGWDEASYMPEIEEEE